MTIARCGLFLSTKKQKKTVMSSTKLPFLCWSGQNFPLTIHPHLTCNLSKRTHFLVKRSTDIRTNKSLDTKNQALKEKKKGDCSKGLDNG
mmetsp:Transcript_1855/g.3208  ORF Transcript_1855/g.3208 Transcript_1855/m.3208 type:complete len:90 (-) Transcript_1855:905-1174(-)